MRGIRILNLVFIFFIYSTAFLSAADETLTITTYYPSPYGVYKTLRLYPSTDATSGSDCTNKEGEMSYNSTDHALYVCSGAPATWQSAGGGGYWAASGNNIYNTNTANVGIGTSSPSQKLHILDTAAGWPLRIATTVNGSTGIEFYNTISGSATEQARIRGGTSGELVLISAVSGSGGVTITTRDAGGTYQDRFRVANDGTVTATGGNIAVDASHAFQVGASVGKTQDVWIDRYNTTEGGSCYANDVYMTFKGGLYLGQYLAKTVYDCATGGY